jgi:hypothetical protein
VRLENDESCPIAPRLLQLIAQLPAANLDEPFLCNRRPGQIPAQSLNTVAIVAIDHRADERWIEIVHRTPLVPEPLHSSAALLQRGDDPLGHALDNLEHFVCRGRRKHAEDRLSHRIILPHIDPVQRERMYMHVETKRRIEAMDERHRPGKRTIDACIPKRRFARLRSERKSSSTNAFTTSARLLRVLFHPDDPLQ